VATTGQTTINFGTGKQDVSIAVTGQAGILSNSLVEAWVFPAITASNTPDNHWVEDLEIMAGNVIAGTGFTIYAKCNTLKAHGIYNIAWVWN
jgi:hypothetical protein